MILLVGNLSDIFYAISSDYFELGILLSWLIPKVLLAISIYFLWFRSEVIMQLLNVDEDEAEKSAGLTSVELLSVSVLVLGMWALIESVPVLIYHLYDVFNFKSIDQRVNANDKTLIVTSLIQFGLGIFLLSNAQNFALKLLKKNSNKAG